jgi:acetyl esterase/lipase
MDPVHPDLARLARFVPRGLAGPRLTPLMRRIAALSRPKPVPGVTVTVLESPSGLRVYRPEVVRSDAALLWIHGGGMVIGQAMDDDHLVGAFARKLGILVASVDYRLAPQHPFPAAVDDCYDGLRWLHEQPGVDRGRIAIGGASAGGGLAASLAQVAHDRRELPIAFQLLVYPMLDDRSGTRSDVDGRQLRLWNQKANRFGWDAYLGGQAAVAPAVPARREDLSGLPPAWIGVGSHDLFLDEDLDYARRLEAAGVTCEVEVVPGAFHGFDHVARKAGVTRDFFAHQVAALSAGLGL